MPTFYLIDGNAYLHRAYHALPPLTTSKGEAVNAVYGFLRLLFKIRNAKRPDYLAVCFDYPAPTFRHKAYAPYKAHRKEIDAELKSQMPLAREAVEALSVCLVEKQGFEADDLIATLARQAEKDGADVVIVTTDKDAFQLVTGRVKVWNEYKDVLYGPEEVKEKYGLAPGQLTDMFALMGDASDNVPGVRGVGEKTAVKLIQRFGSLERLKEGADELEGKLKDTIKGSFAEMDESKFLVTVKDDVPLDLTWQDALARPPEGPRALEFMRRCEFTTLVNEISGDSGPGEAEQKPLPPVQNDFTVRTILSQDEFRDLLTSIGSARQLSVDLETTSTDPHSAKIVGIAIALDTAGASYIPVGHTCEQSPEQLSLNVVLESLRPFLEDPKLKKSGQNIKFDYLIFGYHGIMMQGLHFDTMVASYCLNPSRFTHNLKDITLDYLGQRMTAIDELIGTGKKQISMADVPVERAAPYAAADAVMVLRLQEKLQASLREKKLDTLFHDVEMPLVYVLADMERAGLKINSPYFSRLSGTFAEALAALEKDIYRLAGQEFNPNSPKQLAVILFEKLHLPVIKRTKTGQSTDEEVLKALAPQHELPARLLEYRELQKLKSTYIDSLLKLADAGSQRVHTSFNQTVTATGRLSSSEPNLQNIPIRTEYGREIRRGFIPEQGSLLLSADYSQIDLRVLAHISGDPVLLEAFRKGEDIHTAIAQEVFNVPRENVDTRLRRIAKTINFGIIYGMSPFGLAQQLGISNGEAKEYIENYFTRFSGVRNWLERIVQDARDKGYVATLLGRIRYIPEISAKNVQMRKFAERTAMNAPIQGTSADIIKVAMVRLHKKLHEQGFKTRMLVQVHDELLFEVPEGEMEAVSALVKREMQEALALQVPVVVDMKAGANWADMEPLEKSERVAT